MTTTLATFAAGCFWGTEEAFRTQPGVTATVVGIMDGAEVVQITFDPAQTSYETLLNIFWDNHNPTVANPGGLERSEVFFHDEEQQAVANASKQALERSGRYRKPIATPISPVGTFKRAPEDQQQYYLKHSMTSCEISK
jgi:peptide-methionine (S)-S-oxide reductase